MTRTPRWARVLDSAAARAPPSPAPAAQLVGAVLARGSGLIAPCERRAGRAHVTIRTGSSLRPRPWAPFGPTRCYMMLIHFSEVDTEKFMGEGPVPNLPSLFLLPNSLVDQTVRELKAFQKVFSISVDVIPAQAEAASKFLEDVFLSSPQPAIRRIAVMSHNVSCLNILVLLNPISYVLAGLCRARSAFHQDKVGSRLPR